MKPLKANPQIMVPTPVNNFYLEKKMLKEYIP